MTFLSRVTPVILTFNEAPNIGRVLDRLTWARAILVLDSGSTDETATICARYPNVRLVTRPFDSHAAQWSHAVHETGVQTPWVLAMDADYLMTPQAQAEMESLDGEAAGYWLNFRYAIHGKVLRSGVYPRVLALFQPARARFVQDGHTQRLVLDGPAGEVVSPMIHDDRKPLDRWFTSQIAYAKLEAAKESHGGLRGWIRTRTPFAPLLMAAHILIIRGAVFEGPAGWMYAAQRTLAEALIACARLDRLLKGP